MNIAIDMRGIQTVSFYRGIGSLWRGLMNALAKADRTNKYILIYAKGFPSADDTVEYPDNFEKLYVNVPFFAHKRVHLYLWLVDHWRMKKMLRQCSADVAMLTTFAEPHIPTKTYDIPTLVWVYDLIPFLFREAGFGRFSYRRLKEVFMRMLRWKKVRYASNADFVITLSHSGKDDWIKFTGYPRERVIVIHLGVEQNIRLTHEQILKAKADMNLPEHFILYIGGIDPRKNLHRSLEGYAKALKKVNLPPIVIAGKVDTTPRDYNLLTEKIEKLSLENKVKFLGFVPAEHLFPLYACADFLLFPSLYEGFGLPVLEAMAVGCPVITSNVSSMPEVAGDAALLVDPLSVDDIAGKIEILFQSNDLRQELSRKGIERAKLFTWEKSATTMIELFERVAREKRIGIHYSRNM